MAIRRAASGQVDGTTARPVVLLSVPAIVVVSVLLELADGDAGDRLVGSVAVLLLLIIQIAAFAVNLGIDVPIVPITMGGALAVVVLAVRFEPRSAGG